LIALFGCAILYIIGYPRAPGTLQRGALHVNDFHHLSRPARDCPIGPATGARYIGFVSRRDDLELIAAELIVNVIQHTSSGGVGGVFTITVYAGNGWASIEVTDAGGNSWRPAPGDDNMSNEHGRGLMIAAALADRFGHDADEFGHTVWAEVSW
jgi:Histidine kinase-like ATPase domain